MSEGADGVSLFNYFIPWDERPRLEPDFGVLRELSSLDSLTNKEKLYTLAVPKFPVSNVSLPSQMPLRLQPGVETAVFMRVHEPVRPSSVVLCFESGAELKPEDLKVEFNGWEPGRGFHPAAPQVFPTRIPHPLPPTGRLVQFKIRPEWLHEANVITVRVERELTVQNVDLGVRH